MLVPEESKCKGCVFPQLGTVQRLVVFGAIFGFCVDLLLPLSSFTYMQESVGWAKQAVAMLPSPCIYVHFVVLHQKRVMETPHLEKYVHFEVFFDLM